jgi:hypothetical protein
VSEREGVGGEVKSERCIADILVCKGMGVACVGWNRLGSIHGLCIVSTGLRCGRVRSRGIERATCGLRDSDRGGCDWLDYLDGLPNAYKMCVAGRLGVIWHVER